MRDATVARLGRALGAAARRSVDVARLPRDILRRAFATRDGSGSPEGERRADAQLLGSRISYDRRQRSSRKPASPADVTEALSHPDSAVRVRALRALSLLSRRRAEHLVAPMLHDPHPAVRTAAAEAASELGADSAVFSLIVGLEDSDENVRDTCWDAIGEITGRAPWRGRLDEAARGQKVVELRAWWKEERMSLLARRARADALRA